MIRRTEQRIPAVHYSRSVEKCTHTAETQVFVPCSLDEKKSTSPSHDLNALKMTETQENKDMAKDGAEAGSLASKNPLVKQAMNELTKRRKTLSGGGEKEKAKEQAMDGSTGSRTSTGSHRRCTPINVGFYLLNYVKVRCGGQQCRPGPLHLLAASGPPGQQAQAAFAADSSV